MSKIEIPLEILGNIDFANTMNGGRTKPEITVDRNDSAYTVLVKYPGVDSKTLEIEIDNNNLWIYVLHPVLKGTLAAESFLPFTIGELALPTDIDRDSIYSQYLRPENKWRITLPIK